MAVDWKDKTSLSPKQGRISEAEVKEMALELGLKLEKEFSAGTHHWGLILEKSD